MEPAPRAQPPINDAAVRPFSLPEDRPPHQGVDYPVIVSPGSAGPEAGLENMIRALPAVLTWFPRAVYVVMGVADEASTAAEGRVYLGCLERLAILLGVRTSLQLHIVPREQFEQSIWLSSATIYVFPHRRATEATAEAFTHALTSRTPTIATSALTGVPGMQPDSVVSASYYLSFAEAVTSLLAPHPPDTKRPEVKRSPTAEGPSWGESRPDHHGLAGERLTPELSSQVFSIAKRTSRRQSRSRWS